MAREQIVRILTEHGVPMGRGVRTGRDVRTGRGVQKEGLVEALRKLMEGAEEPSILEKAEVVVQLHFQPALRTRMSFFLYMVSQCWYLSFSLHTLFVGFARLDDFVNVFLLECSSNDDKIVLTWSAMLRYSRHHAYLFLERIAQIDDSLLLC
jgi:hypothetical protein